jgi:MFS family permease
MRASVVPDALRLGWRFYLLLTGSFLSEIGSQATQTALVLQIFALSGGNVVHMGLTTLAGALPGLLVAPAAGVLADRVDRRRLMIACDLARIPLVIALGATARVPALLALTGAIAACTTIFTPARLACVPALVPPERLPLANSLAGWSQSAILLLAPIVGAALFVSGGLRRVAVVDGASYVISLLCLLALGPIAAVSASPPRRGAWFGDVLTGLRYMRDRMDLWALLRLAVAAGLAIGVVLPLLRPFVATALRADDRAYANLLVSFGLGGLIGPALALLAMRRLSIGTAVLIGFAIEAAVMLLWARTTTPLGSAVVFGIWGMFVFALIPCQHTYLHRRVPDRYMARSFAAIDQAFEGAHIIGSGLVVLLGSRMSPARLVATAATVYLAVVALSALGRGGRALRGPAVSDQQQAPEMQRPPVLGEPTA